MTSAEKVRMVQTILGDSTATDSVVKVYLQLACAKMLKRLYPFDDSKEESDIPTSYHTDQCELAVRLFLRKGGEGETSHEENGVNRTYGSVDDEDILSRLTPFAKVGG